MAVLYSEYLGIRENGRHTFLPALGKISLHWGQLRQVADQDELRIGLLRADRMAAWPIDCKTMWIIPEAMSSGEALPSAFPKLEVGGVQRQVGQGPVADVLYLEVDIRQGPFPGHFSDQMDVLRFQEQAGESEQGSASDADAADMLDMRSFNLYEEVPVPMLTTIRFSSEAVYLAPRPLARNSSVLAVGKPYSGWSMKALPTPVSITISISGKVIPLS
mgnify:CR=1 FL=1